MARSAGRNSQIYVSITSGGSASPLLHAATWSLNLNVDQIEVTAFGDTSKTYVAGLADGTLDFSGFLSDTAGTSLVTAAIDGVARKFYLYPFNTTSTYFFGTGFFGTTVETDVAGAVSMTGTAMMATPVTPIGF